MLDLETVRMLVAADSRPWSRLADLGSDDLFDIYITDRSTADQLQKELNELGVVLAIREGMALSAGSPDFWIVVGQLANGAALGGVGLSAIKLFLRTGAGKKLRALLARTPGRKELHPAFSFDALVAWCDRNLGSQRPDGSPAWRFNPEAIWARHLPDGLVALEVHEEISGKVLCLVGDGETITWLSERVQTGPTD